MNKKETLKLLKYLNGYYGNRFELPSNEKELLLRIEPWHDFLKDYDYKTCQIAVKKLISAKEWPPTPGEIVKEIERLKAPEGDNITAGEAWKMVLDVIRRYGVLYGTEEAEKSLPRKVLKTANCVGGLQNIGMSDENDTYFMNMFLKVYNDVSEAIDLDERLPESIRKESQMLAEKFRRPRLEESS